jgi:hypothetical protein
MRICFAALLSLMLLATARAQSPVETMNARISGQVAFLLANKGVQEELKLTEEDVNKVRDWTRDFREKADDIRRSKGVEIITRKFAGKVAPPSAEEKQKIHEANDEIRKASYKELGSILKKDQVERLKQIDLQRMGIEAFRDSEVIAELKLTDTQVTTLKKMIAEMNQTNSEITHAALTVSAEAIQEAAKKVQSNIKETYEKAVAKLSEDQAKKWKEMRGVHFDQDKLRILPIPKKKD